MDGLTTRPRGDRLRPPGQRLVASVNGSENTSTPRAPHGYLRDVSRKFTWPWRIAALAMLLAASGSAFVVMRTKGRRSNFPVAQPTGAASSSSSSSSSSFSSSPQPPGQSQEENRARTRRQEEERRNREADQAKSDAEEKAKWDANRSRPEDGHTWGRLPWRNYIEFHFGMPPGFEHTEVRMMQGDDERWAEPRWDDRAWRDVTHVGVPQRAGVFWIRFRVRAENEGDLEAWKRGGKRGAGARKQLPAAIYNQVNAAFDLYWDGWLLGRSGVPGNRRDEETPGKLDTVFSLPEEWRGPGEHVVAIRMSTHFSDFPGEFTDMTTGFATPQELQAQATQTAFKPTLISGAMFTVAAVGLLLWLLADRRPALLLFVGLCLCGALTQWLTVWRYFFTYTYDWHYPVRLAAIYLSAGYGACLLMFVAVFFNVPHRRWLLAAYLLLAAAIFWLPHGVYLQPMNQKAGWEITGAVLLTFACALWAVWKRRRAAWLVALGLLLSGKVVWAKSGSGEVNASPTTLPAMFGLLSAAALRVRDERRQAEQAQLTAARLEVELLKKNLQPHFLMNTLTALGEVIEQNPGAAVALIDDLATEFRTLARMSGEKQVTLAEEIDLCRVHLRVMSVRTGVTLRLTTWGVDETARVPPAMFLTLIENAFVHQRPTAAEGMFRLGMELVAGGVRYVFTSPGEVRSAETVRVAGGMGLRYVRARLEESFPGRWTFAHRAVPDGWETTIVVRGADAAPVEDDV